MKPIKLYCEKCKEMMPVVLRYSRQSVYRSKAVVADCMPCGAKIREMSILDAVNLGAGLGGIAQATPTPRRRAVLVQETIAGVDPINKKKEREKPQWLKDKIRQGYADRARKHKEAQGELF